MTSSRHRLRHPHVPPALLATLLIAAALAAVLPFVIILSGLEYGIAGDLQWALAAIALFFLIFPLAFRVTARRGRRELV